VEPFGSRRISGYVVCWRPGGLKLSRRLLRARVCCGESVNKFARQRGLLLSAFRLPPLVAQKHRRTGWLLAVQAGSTAMEAATEAATEAAMEVGLVLVLRARGGFRMPPLLWTASWPVGLAQPKPLTSAWGCCMQQATPRLRFGSACSACSASDPVGCTAASLLYM
jgi:hypothetical protein